MNESDLQNLCGAFDHERFAFELQQANYELNEIAQMSALTGE
jgi:hypothetical protein